MERSKGFEIRNSDQKWMERALAMAELGRGKVHPNPMVGAVIVKDNQVIGEGFHRYFGGPHAEIEALMDCSRRGYDPEGAEIFVTLEPCCHYGKTPPCTEALIRSGIHRVVIATEDPNPLVSGMGIEALKKSGIEVKLGVLKDLCLGLNRVFFHYIKTKRPYVILKSATSLDGKIATKSGESQWITSEAAREHGHQVRGSVRAILTGIGTVLADDPLLTCRSQKPSLDQPIRMVLDSRLQIPLNSRLVQSAKEVPLWIITGAGVSQDKQQVLKGLGAVIIECDLDEVEHIDLMALMEVLGQQKVDSLLLEGGSSINDAALRAGIVNEVLFYFAPKLIGGSEAKSGVGGLGVGRLVEAHVLKEIEIIALGEDFLVKGMVQRK